jgi:hypothetical protein
MINPCPIRVREMLIILDIMKDKALNWPFLFILGSNPYPEVDSKIEKRKIHTHNIVVK